jgi:hypothetical protein
VPFLSIIFSVIAKISQFDNKLFAELAKSTPASVQKLFPPIKRKAADAHPSLAAYLGMNANGDSKAAAPKASAPKTNGSKKRKVTADNDGDNADADREGDTSDEKEKKKKAKSTGRSKKAKVVKQEEVDDEI